MVKKKAQSKRLTLRKKYKIQKKVKEHNRKQKKAARQTGQGPQRKKDPGIPNFWPHKAEILADLEASRARELELKAERKAKRAEHIDEDQESVGDVEMVEEETRRPRRSERAPNADVVMETSSARVPAVRSIAELAEGARDRSAAYENENQVDSITMQTPAQLEFSRKAFARDLKRVIDNSDVIIQVLDARDPLGTRSREMEAMVRRASPQKRIVLLLNKIDLVPRPVLVQWLSYLRREYPVVAFKASTQAGRYRSRETVSRSSTGSETVGADAVMKLLKNYCLNAGIKVAITVGLVGYPNTGKSSVINSLLRSRAVNVGATPGITKSVQEVVLDKKIKLLDSPGILLDSSSDSRDSSAVLRNAVRVEQLEDPIAPVEAIISRISPTALQELYEIAAFSTPTEFLVLVAKRRGKIRKGGVLDLQSAARSVLNDWNAGRIPFFSIPPTNQRDSASSGSSIVGEWSKEFSMDAIDDSHLGSVTVEPSVLLALKPSPIEEQETSSMVLSRRKMRSKKGGVDRKPSSALGDSNLEESELKNLQVNQWIRKRFKELRRMKKRGLLTAEHINAVKTEIAEAGLDPFSFDFDLEALLAEDNSDGAASDDDDDDSEEAESDASDSASE